MGNDKQITGECAETSAELDPASRQAVAWFAMMQDHPVNATERKAFGVWLNADADHRKAFAELEYLWARVGDVPCAVSRRRRLQAAK